jgi:hypothetical protein
MFGIPGRRAASIGAAALLSLCLSSCPAALTDFFDESSTVTGRVQDTGAKAIVQPASASISSTDPFSFLVVGDPHFGASFAAGQSTMDAFSALAASPDAGGKPYAFVVYLGDDANSGAQAEYESFVNWASSMTDSVGKKMQWYSAVGNHDLYNGGWTYFRQKIGPSFFRLSAGGYSIYVLDSGQGILGDFQIGELKSEFAADPKPKIVVTHYPIYAAANVLYYYRLSNPREVAELLDLFAKSDVKHIIAGHWHYYGHESVGSMDEWLVESLTVTDGGSAHCFSVDIAGSTAAVTRLAF